MSAQNMTYDQLVASLTSYSVRKDAAFLDSVPRFIMLAENRIATDMKQQGFQTVVTGTLPANNVMAKPSWWRETLSFKFQVAGVYQPLNLRSLEYCQNYWPDPSVVGPPRFYADYNATNFYLCGTPDFQYPFELTYYARLDPLSPEHQENWITLNAPQALLYAAMLEAALWRQNDTEVAKWSAQYQSAAGGQDKEDNERVVDRNVVVR